MASVDDPRACRSCGRRIERPAPRPETERIYCSRRCGRRRIRPLDRELEARLLDMCTERGTGKSLCPSEVARATREEGWRELMEPVRRAARRLAHRGLVEILQRDQAVDPSSFRGPVRIRLVTQGS